jgi:uncharacterized protein YebE (UPF0316 family)
MAILFIGLIEMLVVGVWTKTVTRCQVIASGIVTIFNVFIWWIILRQVLDNIDNLETICWYAIGCSIGTMLSSILFKSREKGHIYEKLFTKSKKK